MGGKYSIMAKKYDSFYWDYSDHCIKNILMLFIKAIYCFSKYKYVEIRKHW